MEAVVATSWWESQASGWRWILAIGAFAAAAAHVPVIGPHLSEAPYMGGLFIVLTAACVGLGVAALTKDVLAVYAMSVVTCGLAILGYVATRLVGFPMLGDDVGNWLEPLGLVSIGSEAAVVVAAVSVLRSATSTSRPAP